MPKVTKVIKYELIYTDNSIDFHTLQQKLWELQKQTREILNKTIQEMYRATAANEKFLENDQYHRFCGEYPDMAASTVNATLREAKKKYSSAIKEVLRGDMSLPSYKRDQPILLHNQSVKLEQFENDYLATLAVLSDNFKKQNDVKFQPKFRLKVSDNNQRSIVHKLISGEYKLGQCQITYKRPKWFLSLVYTHETQENELDKTKILGVDLGCVYAIYASSYGNKGVFKIPGDEITAFERRQAAMQGRTPLSVLDRVEALEERRYAKQQQARYCGEGRIGHGTKTRVATVYADTDKIARFRATINHRYSKALVDYAVKNGCGTIQMEDLSGIKEDNGFPKRLQHWTYFDLQTKIEYKAKEKGIQFIKIDPKYTSQRCSVCGNIDKGNRRTQSDFCCTKCGFRSNADYNASQNISTPNIDKIIKKEIEKGAKQEET